MLAADLVLLNGHVLTVDRDDRVVEAVATFGGRIVATGSTADIKALAGRSTKVVDLGGRTVLPGLTDPHVHLADYGTDELNQLDCRDFHTNCRSLADMLDRIKLEARETPEGEWIIAQGSPMQDFRMPEGRFPTRDDLDAAAPNHPVSIGFGAHLTIVNSRALREKGLGEDVQPPFGGRIERDPATNKLTGRFYERAQFMVRKPIGQSSIEEKKRGIVHAAEKCLRRGVTTIHDIVVDAETIRAYQELLAEKQLPLRASLLLRVFESNIGMESLLNLGLMAGFGNDWLRLGGVKMSIDGGATGHLSAFSEPYHDDPCNSGLIRIKDDELEDVTGRYHEAGHRICLHAMGDVAMDMALSSLTKAIAQNPRADHRHRIEHMGNWMVTRERIETMRKFGIIPVPNIAFGYYLNDSLTAMLGEKRMENSFNLRTMLEAGLPVTSGSDGPSYWPVDILRDIGLAVARQTRTGRRFGTDEALSMRDALRLMTVNAAHCGFEEHSKGSIEAGRLADMIVLAEDPFSAAADHIKDIDIDMTVIDGRVAFSRH